MIIRLIGNLIPLIFGIIAIRKWKVSSFNRLEIFKKLGFKPLLLSQIVSGLVLGAIVFTVIFIIFKQLDYLTIIQFSWTRGSIFATLLLFATSAIVEEIIFRSFFINGLKFYIKSTVIIIIISAVFFSIVHWFNDGSTVLSAVSAFLGGIMYAYAFIKSGNIWYPFGLHFSWNFFQSFVYGFPVSGFDFKGLFEINVFGKELWTGGAYGPEGGLIGILARIMVVVITWMIFRKNRLKTVS